MGDRPIVSRRAAAPPCPQRIEGSALAGGQPVAGTRRAERASVAKDAWRAELRQDPELSRYIRNLPRCKPLREGEQEALADRIQRGDRAAVDRLVQAHLDLVVQVARDLVRRRRKKDLGARELIAEGNIGLVAAARRWNAWTRRPFAEVARGAIKNRMLVALSEEAARLMDWDHGSAPPFGEYQSTLGFIPDRELIARDGEKPRPARRSRSRARREVMS
jgi:DNA-directed RNA polymerase specialized sigma24 family protein